MSQLLSVLEKEWECALYPSGQNVAKFIIYNIVFAQADIGSSLRLYYGSSLEVTTKFCCINALRKIENMPKKTLSCVCLLSDEPLSDTYQVCQNIELNIRGAVCHARYNNRDLWLT